MWPLVDSWLWNTPYIIFSYEVTQDAQLICFHCKQLLANQQQGRHIAPTFLYKVRFCSKTIQVVESILPKVLVWWSYRPPLLFNSLIISTDFQEYDCCIYLEIRKTIMEVEWVKHNLREAFTGLLIFSHIFHHCFHYNNWLLFDSFKTVHENYITEHWGTALKPLFFRLVGQCKRVSVKQIILHCHTSIICKRRSVTLILCLTMTCTFIDAVTINFSFIGNKY